MLPDSGNGPIYVAVVGPPASGKSTLAGVLANAFSAPIIRPRDAIRALVELEPRLHNLYAPINELGWISDGALGVAVRAAVWRVPVDQQTVILENLPGDACQVADLYLWAQKVRGRVLMLHLDSDDELLMNRGIARRVCQTCERDRSGDPHEPACASSSESSQCAKCGSQVTARRDDESDVLRNRMRRHRQYFQGVRATAEALALPLITLDASQSEVDVQNDALTALDELLTSSAIRKRR